MDNFFSSWSGGKDSAIAFNEAIKKGLSPKFMLTMMNDEGDYSRSHSIPAKVLEKQAELTNVKLLSSKSTWKEYEKNFLDLASPHLEGISHAVFGDIDIEDHKKWEEKICSKLGVEPFLPLFGLSRENVLNIYLNEGFEAYIVTVNRDFLDRSFLGKKLDRDLISEIVKNGADGCGENGEYHTLVTNTPFFSKKLEVEFGKVVDIKNYSFIEIKLKD
ncbi:MAG: adenosine nucleotide hydrolase [Candidatus Delongbacteria bacterium]|nr:MAG: adenosine nucleotide hydrolase [Candidatus Delongbacteria bacterium]